MTCIAGQITARNIVPTIFRIFLPFHNNVAKPSFLYVYLDNKTACLIHFQFFPIFQDSWKILAEKSAEMYGEGNERQLCVGDRERFQNFGWMKLNKGRRWVFLRFTDYNWKVKF